MWTRYLLKKHEIKWNYKTFFSIISELIKKVILIDFNKY